MDPNIRPATKDTWWQPTAEELEEERLLEEMLPGAYRKGPEPEEAVNHDASGGDGQGSDALSTPSSSAGTLSQRRGSGATLADADGSEGRAAATDDERRERRPPHEDRRRPAPGEPVSVVSAVGSVLQWRGGERAKASASAAAAAAAMADEETEESAVVPADILEGENRDLVIRLKNELDEARQVETKMTEVGGGKWLPRERDGPSCPA